MHIAISIIACVCGHVCVFVCVVCVVCVCMSCVIHVFASIVY